MAPLHLVQAGGRKNGLERVASPTNDDSDRSKTKLSLSTRCPPPILTKTTRPQAIRYASLGIPLQLSTPSPDRMKQNLHIGAGAHVAIRGLFPGRFIVGGYKCEPWFVAPGLHMRLEPGRTSLPIYPQCRDIQRLDQRHRGNDKRSVRPWPKTHLARISQTVAKAIGMRSISWGQTMFALGFSSIYSWLARSARGGTGREAVECPIKCRLTGSTFSSFPLEPTKGNEDSWAQHRRSGLVVAVASASPGVATGAERARGDEDGSCPRFRTNNLTLESNNGRRWTAHTPHTRT